jgi:multiple sugar transport system ATP-binding protein
MTVRQNMAFALELAHTPDDVIKAKVEEAATVLDLTQHLDRKPANLSGGQRQRVAMGRAIVRDPAAFLMDEPLSNLDAKLRVQMRTEVSRLQKRLDTTMVYVTHDQTEAMTLGDRVAVMRGGKIQQYAAPQALYEHPDNLFVAGFMGSPSMNFMTATAENGVLRCKLGDIPMSDALKQSMSSAKAGREVIAGVRPENFEDAALVDSAVREHGITFTATIDVVESLGSDVFAYFTPSGHDASDVGPGHAELAELAADSGASDTGGDAGQITARLDAASKISYGDNATLWVDARKVHVFDAETGRSLTSAPAAAG